MHNFLQHHWQKRGWWAWLCSPLSVLVCSLASIKRAGYQLGLFKAYPAQLPIIVIGNLTVGGTGKSPLVIHIVNQLLARGFRPAIITRGYKGSHSQWPALVNKHSDPHAYGDEAVLLANQTGVPVVAGPDRIASVKKIIKSYDCNVVISDDGFQHLRLARSMDILVIDGRRGYGNGWCLPSGPLRESTRATKAAQLVVCNGSAEQRQQLVDKGLAKKMLLMQMSLHEAYSLDGKQIRALSAFDQVHAVAGIGHPERFFSQLEQAGMTIIRHPFPDHHNFCTADIDFADDLPVLLTEKDAVKCHSLTLNNSTHYWSVPLRLDFDASVVEEIIDTIKYA